MEELLIAFAGAASMISLATAVWLPAHARESAVKRRIAGFVAAGTGAHRALAVDLGGRRRRVALGAGSGAAGNRLVRGLEQRLATAGVDLAAGELLTGVAAVAMGLFIVLLLVSEALVAVLGAAAVPVLANMWLARKAAGIQKRFSAQFADTVSLLASSVRSGHSIQQALEQVSHETPEPTRSAFAVCVREIGFGASLDDALARLAQRYPSEDMQLVTTAITVNAAIGGSLAKVLNVAADTIRERARMVAEIKALTAQQQYSAYVIALLPVFTLVALKLISPDYINELFKGMLRFALAGAALMVFLGFMIMKKIATIDE